MGAGWRKSYVSHLFCAERGTPMERSSSAVQVFWGVEEECRHEMQPMASDDNRVTWSVKKSKSRPNLWKVFPLHTYPETENLPDFFESRELAEKEARRRNIFNR